MTQEDLIKAFDLNDRRNKLSQLKYFVSKPHLLKFGGWECSNSGSLIPIIGSDDFVRLNYEPELSKIIKDWVEKTLTDINQEIEKL